MIKRIFSALLLLPLVGMAQLEIDQLNQQFTIDFDATVNGVNNGAYQGAGFSSGPASGQLNSNAWSFENLGTPASMNFGGNATTGDAARGVSSGGVTTAGFYAFNTNNGVGAADYAMGWQVDGTTFYNGKLTLMIINNTLDNIETFRLGYILKEYNNTDTSANIRVSYSFDNNTYTDIPELADSTTSEMDPTPQWQSKQLSAVLNGLGFVPSDTLYIQWQVESDSNPQDEMAIDGLSFYAYEVDYLWDGSNWNVDPSGVNDTSKTALVLKGSSPALISDEMVVGTLTMAPGARFDQDGYIITLGPGKTSTFMADANGYSQVNGQIIGNVAYQMYYTSDSARYFNVGIPVDATFDDVSGMPLNITGTASSTNVWWYDATVDVDTDGEGDFKPATAMSDATDGKGWQIYAGDGTYFGSAPFTMTTTGTLLSGNISLNVSDATDSNFNILPNPYPSTIDWDQVVTDNSTKLTSTYYMQDGSVDDTDYRYRTYNGTIGANGGTQYIAPGMSYFVQVLPSATSVDFNDGQRTLEDGISLYGVHSTVKLIKVYTRLSGTKYFDETVVGFKSGLTDGKDANFDGGKFFNGGYPNLYTTGQGGNYTYNGMDDTFTTKSVDLNFEGDYNGTYDIKLNEDWLPASWTVELEDKLTNTRTDIRKNTYAFSHQKGNNKERFVLHFNQQGAVGIDESQISEVYSFAKDNMLTVKMGQLSGELKVYDAVGREVYSTNAESNDVQIEMNNWAAGTYILKVYSAGENIHTNKVIKK